MNALQNPLALIGRLLLAYFFIPAGIGKIGGFAGTVGYIASKGMPLPEGVRCWPSSWKSAWG